MGEFGMQMCYPAGLSRTDNTIPRGCWRFPGNCKMHGPRVSLKNNFKPFAFYFFRSTKAAQGSQRSIASKQKLAIVGCSNFSSKTLTRS